MKRFKDHLQEEAELDEGLAGAAVGGAGGAALGYKKFGTLGGIAGGIIGAAGGSGVEDGYKSTRKKKKNEDVEQVDEISKELAGRYLKKAPARAADAGDKIARASQAYDRKSGDAQRKKGIRTFLNVHKGVERATNRLMKKESVIDEVSSEKLADYANKAINDRNRAKRDAERASDSAGANRFRGDNKAAERDDAKAANAKDRVRRRNRGAGLYTRKMLTKKEDQSE